MFVLITLGTKSGLDCPSTTSKSPCSIMARVTFFTHFCNCSVKAELIYRNNSFPGRRNSVLTISHHLFFWALFWIMDSWIGILGVGFLQMSTYLLCNSVPFSSWTVFTNRIPFLFWSRSKEWPLSCSKSLCLERGTSWAFDSHSFLLSLDVLRVFRRSRGKHGWILHTASRYQIRHRLWFCFKNMCLDLTWHERWTRLSFQNGSLRSIVTLCARDWWLVHHQTKTNTSMKSLPRLLFSLHRSHLIVRISIFQICRTSVSLWDFLYFWWNANCLSNSSPWIQVLAM